MTTLDWQLGTHDRETLVFLEFLYEAGAGTQPVDDASPPGMDRERAQALANAAEAAGYVRVIPERWSMAEIVPPLRLEGAGVALVEQVRAARTSRVERNHACRTALMVWMYDRNAPALDTRELCGSDWTFYGDAFTPEEVHDAAKYLDGMSLISGTVQAGPAHVLAGLTSSGTACVEEHGGDVRAYQQAMRSSGPTNIQNVYGGISGQNAQGSHIQQTQHSGIDAAELGAIFTAMREVIATLPPTGERDDLELAVSDLERDATTTQPDATRVQSRLGALRRLLGRAADSATTAAGGAIGAQLIPLVDRLAQLFT